MAPPPGAAVRHFKSAAELRRWLEARHARAEELWVGFHSKASGLGGPTYAEALDEALCFGWIDGVRYGLDATSYTIRLTPRRPRSIWSRINVGHVERLAAAGRMRPAGLAAFEARQAHKSGAYSFEQRPQTLPDELRRRFQADPKAWAFWETQPPGYRRTATYWVVSAKQEGTRLRRLAALVDDSAHGRRLAQLTRPGGGASAPPAAPPARARSGARRLASAPRGRGRPAR